MARYLTVALLLIGSGLLMGSCVVSAQLWTRATQAETKLEQQRAELEQFKANAQQDRSDLVTVSHTRSRLEADLNEVTQERDASLDEAAALRRKLVALEAQNSELLKAATQAESLSEQVVALKHQLDQAVADQTAVGPAGVDRADTAPAAANQADPAPADVARTSLRGRALVRVQKPVADPQVEKSRRRDAGWKSAAR